MASFPSVGRPPPQRLDIASPPQLTCALCRERKVKCDKLEPCTTCVSAGVECVSVYRPRLPRGRHAPRRDGDRGRQSSKQRRPQQQQQHPPPPPLSLYTSGQLRNDIHGTVAHVTSHAGNTSSFTPSITHGIGPSSAGMAPYGSGLSDEKKPPILPLGSPPSLRPSPLTDSAISSRPVSAERAVTSAVVDELSWADAFGADGRGRYIKSPQSYMQTASPLSNSSGSTPTASADITTPGRQIPAVLLSGAANTPQYQTLFPSGLDNTTIDLSPHHAIDPRQLCQIYLENVDPIIKILHRQSLSKFMEHGERYLQYPENHPAVVALSAAVCFAAVCSLSETRCHALLRSSKISLAAQTQRACEVTLEQAGILKTTDVTVLQAFVLYLVCRRAKEQGRIVYSLVSLAVRLAKGISLHTHPVSHGQGRSESFYDGQIRRRLWLTICLLDLQAAIVHGTEPLIPVDEVSTSLSGLKHINDADFSPNTLDDIPDKEELTDTTLSIVMFNSLISGRLLHVPRVRPRTDRGSRSSFSGISHRTDEFSYSISPGEKVARERVAAAFDQKAFTLLRFCDPKESPRAWSVWHGTQCLVATIRLAALRPATQAMNFGADEGCKTPTSPSADSRGDGQLQWALRVLEKVRLIHTDPRSEPLRWYTTTPWHALAVAVPICLECTDDRLLRRAWPIIEFVWQLHQSQSDPRDQRAVPSLLESKIRQGRDMLRQLQQRDGVASPPLDPWSIPTASGGGTMLGLSPPFLSTSPSAITTPDYFACLNAVNAPDCCGMPMSRPTSSSDIPLPIETARRVPPPVQDVFPIHPAAFPMDYVMPGAAVGHCPQLQAWPESLLCSTQHLAGWEDTSAGNFMDELWMSL